ncbi:MAG TPA: methylmalonyl Co-A mutase-associated GTPase MeaB [Polyangiaceae bacterium]|jgi:LAO/AO transport system kinase
MPPRAIDVGKLAARVLARERAAVAEALNLTEDRRAPSRQALAELLAALRASGGMDRAHRVGITGPPGVGKSTLVSALVRSIRGDSQRTVGVLAVDPSSIRSGGALLGDRTRIAPDPADHGVFVRSLATAGDLGGLARSVPLGVLVLSAAYDVTLVETVGVGQTETDVGHVVDSVAFVVQPGSGDALQFLKAGIMEVPDVLVVNKADQSELARRAVAELRAALASLHGAGIGARGDTPILATSAREGTGVAELWTALSARREVLGKSGALASRRRGGAIAWGARAFTRRHGEAGVERVGGDEALERSIAARLDAGEEIPAIIERLLGP